MLGPFFVSAIPILPGPAQGKERSSHWPSVRNAFIREHNTCAACGGKYHLEVHHVKPFHLHPELELDPTNFVTLCDPHHLLFGHLMNWSAYNPRVREDAAEWLAKIRVRPAA